MENKTLSLFKIFMSENVIKQVTDVLKNDDINFI